MKKPSGNTINKVLVVLIVTLGALGAISYYSYRSYSDFSEAVGHLYEPKEETSITEKILTDVSELESRSRAYSLTFSESDLHAYLEKVEELREHIDSLYLKSFGTDYEDEADTLRSLFRQKTKSFEDLIKLKISHSRREEDRMALGALAKTQATIKADSLLMPKQEITTTTITETDDEEERGLLKRIFGKNEKEEGVKKEVMQERTVAYDSAYFEKVDTLISSVKEALRKAETRRQRQTDQLEKQELSMVANDQRIINQLRAIILNIKQLESDRAEAEKKQTLAVARKSFSSVMLFALCGGVLTMVLIFLVLRDILKNQRMQVELARAKNEAECLANVKEEFLANMSHEIRTPLNAIIGFSEQLSSSELSEEQRLKLDNVRSSSEHLLMLVNDILDYSKIESGKLRLEEIGFKAPMVIEESLATLEHLARQKDIELRQEVDPELEDIILKGDPIRLKQILINLAGNGVKFTDSGYVKITAKIESHDAENVRVHFEVEDTGKGIAATKLQSIFEGFSQEDSSINSRYGGTGLGLTISKQLVQIQQGKIDVESHPGEGSTFSVWLDYGTAEEESYSGKFDPDRVEINLKGHSLLMIDDDKVNHVLLKPAFERWGLEFESAYNGDEGVAKATQKHYDYILVDLQMPGKSGFEVIEAIRESSSVSAASNVVLCTANALVQYSDSEALQKVDATLLKPFKEYEVAALLGGLPPSETENGEELPMESEKYSLENFNAFAGDDPEMLRQFLISFIETNREHLHLLETHFEEKDYHNVGEVAHKMKNTFGQLKAAEVMSRLTELEKLVNASQPKRLIRERIDETWERAEEIFKLLEKDIERLEPEGQTFKS